MTVMYDWNGEHRRRCFSVDQSGELVPAECMKAASPQMTPRHGTGLGDVVAAATKAVGVQPCGRCRKRQETLNKATPPWAKKFLGKILPP